jgi:hypothetical protein
MLDYQIQRHVAKVGALLEETKFDGIKLLRQGVEKLMKYKRYQRKKQFKFNDLIAFLKKHNQEEINKAEHEQKQLVDVILPVVRQRVQKLISDRVNRIITGYERQQFKIEKMVQVLQKINQALMIKNEKEE